MRNLVSRPSFNLSGKREIVSRLVGSLGLIRGLGSMRSAMVKDLRALAYHRVLPRLDETNFAFDVELVSAVQEEFEWQMAYIARNFHPVSCQEIADAIILRKPLPKRSIIVTFDDGFSDNYEVAFPVLRRRGLSALFFISTGYIGTSRIFWFDRIVHLLLRTSAPSIKLDTLGLSIELGSTDSERRAAASKLLRVLKVTNESLRLQVIEELESVAGRLISDSDRAQSVPMTWDQVREMVDAGMEFGSHTVSHPILSTISDTSILSFELGESKAVIERETGQRVFALAYPVGGRDAVNAKVLAATEFAGYQFAFTYQSGANKHLLDDRFSLKRLHVERYTSRAKFSAMLEIPEIFGT